MNEKRLVLSEDLVTLDLQASNWSEALSLMSELLINEKIVKDSFKQAVIDREGVYPTGLQSNTIGVAIPHTDSEHVNVQAISVATLKEPVPFIHMGTEDMEVSVELILMLAIKDPNEQLTLLQKLMDILQKEDVLADIKNSTDKVEIVDILMKELF